MPKVEDSQKKFVTPFPSSPLKYLACAHGFFFLLRRVVSKYLKG
jgi:hypothetical protein